MHTQFPILPVPINLYMNTPFPLTGNNFDTDMVFLYSSIVLYSSYNIWGRYLIIVLVRDIIYTISYSDSYLKVTPVLLVSYSYD